MINAKTRNSFNKHKYKLTSRVLPAIRVALAVILAGAVVLTTFAILTIRSTEQEFLALSNINSGIGDITVNAYRILLSHSSSSDEEHLANAIQRYEDARDEMPDRLDRYESLDDLKRMQTYISGALMSMLEALDELRRNGLPGGNRSLIEREHISRIRGIEETHAASGYITLVNVINEMNFFLQETSLIHREVVDELTREITGRRITARRIISVAVALYLAVFILAVFLVAISRIYKAGIAEEAAMQRSQALENLVTARTADLEIQNRQLKEARDRLVENEKMHALGQVVSGVAHEVNTPLGICVTATSFLADRLNDKEQPLDQEETRELITLILNNITRASNLIKGFKKVAIDEMDDMMRSFDLAPYLRDDLLPGLKPMLVTKHHVISFEGPDTCPMYAYPGSIAQVVTNLVANASIHGYGKNRRGGIRIHLQIENNQVYLSVADDGRGMDQDVRPHIYEPFFTTNREEGGSGLGLMVVYNLVHGKLMGEIRCRTAPDNGTTFSVSFPADLRDVPGLNGSDIY